jgi:hypothetical protein
LIIVTFRASFTTKHEPIAKAKIARVCDHGKGISPGRPLRVKAVPVKASPARAAMRALLGIVDQNAWRSRVDTTENTAK